MRPEPFAPKRELLQVLRLPGAGSVLNSAANHLPLRIDPRIPRTTCLPMELPMLLAALLAIASSTLSFLPVPVKISGNPQPCSLGACRSVRDSASGAELWLNRSLRALSCSYADSRSIRSSYFPYNGLELITIVRSSAEMEPILEVGGAMRARWTTLGAPEASKVETRPSPTSSSVITRAVSSFGFCLNV